MFSTFDQLFKALIVFTAFFASILFPDLGRCTSDDDFLNEGKTGTTIDIPEAPAPKVITTQDMKNEIAQLKTKLTDDKKSLPVRLEMANLYSKLGENDQVILILKPVFEYLPAEGYFLMANGYANKKDWSNQINCLQQILNANDKDFVAHTQMGQALLNTKNFDEAVSHLRTAINLNPKYIQAYERLLEAFNLNTSSKGKTSYRYEHRNILLDMVKVFGAKPRLLNEICRLYAEDNYLDNTKISCKEAIDLDPNFADNYVYYGQALIDIGKTAEGKKIILNAAKRFAKSELCQRKSGQIYVEDKNNIMAQKAFKLCITHNEKSALCQLGYGKTSFDLKEYAESLKAFISACRLDSPTVLPEFKTATARLRREKNYVWEERFVTSHKLCFSN